MTAIEWVDVLETGYPDLDREHQALIEECNALTALVQNRGAWSAIVAGVRALAHGCAAHFRLEEHLLEDTEFPRCEAHKQQHEKIEQRFEELAGFLASVDGSLPEHWEAARSMRGALLDVLFRHDLDYKSHLQHVAGR